MQRNFLGVPSTLCHCSGVMSEQLRELIEAARNVEVSPEDLDHQRRSFAYGNANIENSLVTPETVERALEQLRDASERT